MVQVNNLRKYYGKVLAVDELSFQVAPGEAIALWGANGAGKTTVLRALLGVIPFDGSITLAGFDVRRQEKKARRQVGFVPQELSFHDDLTVQETVEFYARLKKIKLGAENQDQAEPVFTHSIDALLERLELSVHLEKEVGELSGGMKQRLALAIALLADPPILMLDEPTSNLDVHGREDLLDLLAGLKAEGKTLIFSSHRFDEVSRLADRVLVLKSGKLVADRSPEELQDYAGWRASLRLSVPQDAVQAALKTLQDAGYSATPNGRGIWVQVNPDYKGLPISTLNEAGIQVFDFEIEREGAEEYD